MICPTARKAFSCAALLLVTSIFAHRASALTIVVVDPDNYAAGTNLSNVIDGLKISSLRQFGQFDDPPGVDPRAFDPLRRDVFSVSYSGGESMFGTENGGFTTAFLYNYRGCSAGNAPSGCFEGYSVMEFQLETPTNFVQFTFGHHLPGPGLIAYDSAGNEIAYCLQGYHPDICPSSTFAINSFYEEGSSLSLFTSDFNISRIVVGGSLDSASVNQFLFARSVPEPGTLALLGLGLVGLGFAKRRKQS